MKKSVYLLIIMFTFIIGSQRVLATDAIYSLSNPEQICNEVKNGNVKIGIDSYYNQTSYYMTPLTDKCNNFNDPLIKDVMEGEEYASWVRFGQNDAQHDYWYDDIIAIRSEKRYFFINSKSTEYNATTGKINQQATLKPGENIFVEVELDDIDASNLNDLRLVIDYGMTSADRNISLYNSIAYYVYTNDNTKYGPYRLADASYINRNYYGKGSPTSRIDEYRLVSENLLNNIPNNVVISKIKVVPHEFFPIHSGAFRFYSIILNDYENGYNNKEFITVANAEDKTRHNIVNNMINASTLKWNISPSSQVRLHFYSHYGTNNPKLYDPNSDEIYYGIPYVNTINATINSFLSQTTENANGFHSYNLTETYLADAQSTKFKIDNPDSSELNIKKGDTIDGDLYVYEVFESSDKKTTRKRNLEQNDFVINSPGYLFGQDCSSSTFYATGTELPYLDSMAGSRRYYHNNQVKLLGNIDFTYKGLEAFLRENNVLDSDTQSILGNYDNYYSTYIKRINNSEQIYNGYALLLPGDFVSKSGHIRMVSGYGSVVCNDGASTNQYSEGFCNNHNGINPNESYVIITEIGSSKNTNHIKSSETGWEIELSDNTDILNVDDLWEYNVELDDQGKEIITYNIDPSLRSFNINAKYTYSALYGEDNIGDGEIDSEPGMYLPFRYVTMDNASQNKIEKPTARVVLDKEYENVNDIMTTYVKENKKLKGLLVTNYMINGIKISVNNQKYYIYPNQTNVFSLSTDIKNNEILDAIANINYDNDFEIKVSINYGPKISEVKNNMNLDDEEYSEVLRISRKTVTPSVSSCSDKTYDGGTSATCTISLTGVETGDTVSASGTCTFDNKNVGTNHTVTCSSITLGGADKDRYSLNGTSKTKTGVKITAKSITITTKNQSITYGKNIATGVEQVTVAALVDGDSLTAITLTPSTSEPTTNGTITPSAAVIKDNSGAGSEVTSNYNITYTAGTLTIGKKQLTPTVSSCSDKTYDGGTSASCTITLATVETGDTVTASGTCTFDNKNVGTNHTVTCSSIALAGADKDKYSLSATSKTKTGVKITAKAITITAKNQSITYGGSITTGVGQVTVATLASGDSLTAITLTPSTSEPTTTGTITPSAAVIKDNSGAGSEVTSNYSITYTAGTLTIGKKQLTPTVSSCSDKTYDGGTSATCTISLTGVETGDTVSASGTCTFDNKNVGTNHTVTCSSITLDGADKDKYSLNGTSKTKTGVKITAKSITITAKNQSITYGENIATGTGQVTVAALVDGDSLTAITLTPSTNNYTTNGTITPSAAVIKDNSGAGSDVTSNYAITYNMGTLIISNYKKGDLNHNNKIDLSDIITLLKVYLNDNPTIEQIQIGDMNVNGRIDLSDVILLLKEYLSND